MKDTMKKITMLFTVAIMIIMFAMSASALKTTGQCGENAYWSFSELTGQLIISGTGDIYDYEGLSPFYDNDSIIDVVIEEGITSVGSKTFQNCTNLATVKLPNSINKIGSYAFYKCKKITEIKFSDNLTQIDYEAFFGCLGLEKIKIPKSVTSMEKYCFYGCGIKELVVDGCEFIDVAAFMSCEKLEKVIIKRGTTCVDNSAFDGCKKLKEVYLPITILKISPFAFANNNSLSDIYYEGSKDMFEKVKIATMMNEDFKNANVHYLYVYPEEICSHTYSSVITNPTCTEKGYTTYTCACGDSYIADYVNALGHKDKNGDYKCDNGCGYEFEKPAPEEPSKDCSCNCHKGGISGFFWKIINLFNKLFKSKQYCGCGAKHW